MAGQWIEVWGKKTDIFNAGRELCNDRWKPRQLQFKVPKVEHNRPEMTERGKILRIQELNYEAMLVGLS
jgi:hypothetical protein